MMLRPQDTSPAAAPEEMVATLDTTTEAEDSSTDPAGEPPARGGLEAVLEERAPGADITGHTNILCFDKN